MEIIDKTENSINPMLEKMYVLKYFSLVVNSLHNFRGAVFPQIWATVSSVQGICAPFAFGTILCVPENNDTCNRHKFLEYIPQFVSSYRLWKNCYKLIDMNKFSVRISLN